MNFIYIRGVPFDIQGGGHGFFEENKKRTTVLTKRKKNVLWLVKKKNENLDSLEKKCTLLVILDFHLLRDSNLKIPFFLHLAALGAFSTENLPFHVAHDKLSLFTFISSVLPFFVIALTVSGPVQDGLACITPLINPLLEVILMGTSTH